jgi:hypothetical protein
MNETTRSAIAELMRVVQSINSADGPLTPLEISHWILGRVKELAGGTEPETQTDAHIEFLIHAMRVAERSQALDHKWRPPNNWDRATFHAQLEEATGEALRVDDPLADSLIAQAQAIGMQPIDLSVWIYDSPRMRPRTPAELAGWAHRHGFGVARCGHCGGPVADPERHQCTKN